MKMNTPRRCDIYSVRDLMAFAVLSAVILTATSRISYPSGACLIVMFAGLWMQWGRIAWFAFLASVVVSVVVPPAAIGAHKFLVMNANIRAILIVEIAVILIVATRFAKSCVTPPQKTRRPKPEYGDISE